MIRTEDLTMVYENETAVVNKLNLNVEEGDIFGFLGPNGAGKTTTIRMLTGILKPTYGKVFINGMDIDDNQNDIKRIIGVLPESHGYYNWMTGEEYLMYFAALFNMDKKKSEDHVTYLLEKVGLKDKKGSIIGHYSRGMRQRLGIAKALINNPKIIFLDEPTLGLDPIGQKDIHNLILEINEAMNVTVFITSHLLKDIEVLCNRVSIIQKGRLIEQGTIKDLQQKYSDDEIIKLRTSDNKRAVQQLMNMEFIEDIDIKDDYIFISIGKSSELAAEVVKHRMIEKLFTNSIDIYEVGKVETSMEDIFFKLTENKNAGEVN